MGTIIKITCRTPTMNTSKQFLLQTLSLGTLLLVIMTTTDAGLYRWVDAAGKVHFSDKVPAKVAKQGHSELGENGVEKNKVLSANELQQIKADKKKNAKQNKLLAEKLKKKNNLWQRKPNAMSIYYLLMIQKKSSIVFTKTNLRCYLAQLIFYFREIKF